MRTHGVGRTIAKLSQFEAEIHERMTDQHPHSDTSSAVRILVCADDLSVQQELRCGLTQPEWVVDVAESLDMAAELVASDRPSICLVDESVIGADFARAMPLNDRNRAATEFLFLIHEDADELRGLLQQYARISGNEIHVFEKPFRPSNLRAFAQAVTAKSQLSSENYRLRIQVQNRTLFETLGAGHHIAKLCERVSEAARSSAPIAIHGERGTGKPAIARAIHETSCHSEQPFISLDCRLLTESQLEGELFEFTSAHDDLRESCAGTLFLSEIESMCESLQRRVANSIRHSAGMNVRHGGFRFSGMRIVVSSNSASRPNGQDQTPLVHELTNSLGATEIQVPALREHCEDIPILAKSILRQISVANGHPPRQLSHSAQSALSQHSWPGNVRELRQVLERACALECRTLLLAESILAWIPSDADANKNHIQAMTLKDMERKLIEATFARCRGNRERTAAELRIGIRTLSGKLREYGYPPRGGPGSNQREPLKKAA